MNTSSFNEALQDAKNAIENLHTEAQELINELDLIIEACDTIEDAL